MYEGLPEFQAAGRRLVRARDDAEFAKALHAIVRIGRQLVDPEALFGDQPLKVPPPDYLTGWHPSLEEITALTPRERLALAWTLMVAIADSGHPETIVGCFARMLQRALDTTPGYWDHRPVVALMAEQFFRPAIEAIEDQQLVDENEHAIMDRNRLVRRVRCAVESDQRLAGSRFAAIEDALSAPSLSALVGDLEAAASEHAEEVAGQLDGAGARGVERLGPVAAGGVAWAVMRQLAQKGGPAAWHRTKRESQPISRGAQPPVASLEDLNAALAHAVQAWLDAHPVQAKQPPAVESAALPETRVAWVASSEFADLLSVHSAGELAAHVDRVTGPDQTHSIPTLLLDERDGQVKRLDHEGSGKALRRGAFDVLWVLLHARGSVAISRLGVRLRGRSESPSDASVLEAAQRLSGRVNGGRDSRDFVSFDRVDGIDARYGWQPKVGARWLLAFEPGRTPPET